MARPLRIEYDGAAYHITSRGNTRNPIYKEDENRRTGDYIRAGSEGQVSTFHKDTEDNHLTAASIGSDNPPEKIWRTNPHR
jgi:hypothetical protein